VLEDANRSFALATERARTLKEAFVRSSRRAGSSVPALDGVSLDIEPGEAVGIVGRNGAGKTSTLRCLAGIVPLDSGRAECGGRVSSLLELGAGFGEDFTGRENVYFSGALHGFTRQEIEARVEEIVEFSELGAFIDVAVKAYSAGMFLRLGFSIAAFLDADVMLIDEILAVGDESFQRKCLAKIAERMESGATLVLVSHDPSAIERVCKRLVVLDGGQVRYDGPVADGLLFYHRLLGAEAPRSRSLRHAGEDALEVLELELVDADGRARHVFRPGESLRVAMRVRARDPADRAVAALEVRDQRGRTCFRTTATLGTLDGEVAVAFDVTRLALLGGDYDVAVGVYAQDAPAGELLDRVTKFSVPDTLEGEGISDLRGSWTVAGQAAEEVVG
jgi:ABC-type polysaccharide/polyol phosphate transport system ATPase subunit